MCSVFFKQKSAFEMRISDLISDVCSSDLGPSNPLHLATDTRKSSPMRSAIVAISLLCSHESSKLVGAVVMMVAPLIFVEKSPSASGWSRGCPSREDRDCALGSAEIGSASCRESVGQSV